MRLNGKEMEVVREFKHLGSTILSGGEMDVEVRHRLNIEGSILVK